jgi:hypothetical protein
LTALARSIADRIAAVKALRRRKTRNREPNRGCREFGPSFARNGKFRQWRGGAARQK